MEKLGDIIKSAEGISEPNLCFNFLDSLHLSDDDFRLVMRARCRTIGFSYAAYKKYGQKLYGVEEVHNMIVAAESSSGHQS